MLASQTQNLRSGADTEYAGKLGLVLWHALQAMSVRLEDNQIAQSVIMCDQGLRLLEVSTGTAYHRLHSLCAGSVIWNGEHLSVSAFYSMHLTL